MLLHLLLLLLLRFSAAALAHVDEAQVAQLKHLFLQHLPDQAKPSVQALVDDVTAMGPGRIECVGASSPEPLFEIEFGMKSRDQAVSLRSISKLLASLAVLKLQEIGEFDMYAPHGFCKNNAIGNASIPDLLSMNSIAMDGKANAFRVKQNRAANVNMHDVLGFAPLCDELGLKPLACVEEFLCPFYDGEPRAIALAGASLQEYEQIPDASCPPITREMRARCEHYRRRGDCETGAEWMQKNCAMVCDEICRSSSRNTLKRELLGPNERWEYYFANNRVERKRTKRCVYDNYGYTIVDAAVFKRTGHYLEHWVSELVFKPIGMEGSLACLNREMCHLDCLSPPNNAEEWYSGAFSPWPGGSMTENWVGNSFFASARDLSLLFQVLLNNGTSSTGQRVFAEETVHFLFKSKPYQGERPLGQCMGAQEFGFGLGYCRGRERDNPWRDLPLLDSNASALHEIQPGTSMCTSAETYYWASSHGSRFSIVRSGVACYALLNQPIEHAARSHFLGHNMSALLREVERW